jgi:hypothetical protein
MTTKFRSRVLQTPVVGLTGVQTALEVDDLRRRDGLDLEEVLRRFGKGLGDLGAEGFDTLTTQLATVTESQGRGRVIARYAGTTPGVVAPMTTLRQSGIQPIGNVGASIVFQFDEPAPSAAYTVAYSSLSGGVAFGMQFRISAPTITGFTLQNLTSGGGASSPAANVWTFALSVIDGDDE